MVLEIESVKMDDLLPTVRYRNKFLYYINSITVEPTMTLYMMAFMTTSVVEQSFYVYKACTVNHGFNKTVCDNISNPIYKNITREVQSTTAKFHIWNNIAAHLVPIVLALYIGAWSDKRGRKLPLLIGLLGKLIFSLMLVVNSMQEDWPVEYIIFTATLPCAFTGADVTIFATAFAYLVDTTSVKNRTMRVTLLEVCYLATMPTGVALGSYLFKNLKSYQCMFIINSSLMVLAIAYTAVRLKWRSNCRQRPLSEANNKWLDFFDYNHALATLRMFYDKRSNNRRRYFLILIIMMALYTFQRDEREVMFMYCQYVFHWAVGQFSFFKSIQSALQDILLLVAVPIISKCLGWRDTFIIMIGAGAHAVGRIFYSVGEVYPFYVGGAFAALGPIVAPVIRSLVSKIVSMSEKGKAFAILAVADQAVPLISGTCYSALYNITMHFNPGAVFYLTIATQLGVLFLTLYIHLKTKEDEFDEEPVVPNYNNENDRLNEGINS